MGSKTIQSISCLVVTLLSLQTFAADKIKVTVKTKERSAVAIGFTVDSREFGTLGRSYSGKGPVNKEYHFGYKKDSIFGDNIDCGALTLTKDSTIVLVYENNKCSTIPG